MQKEINDTSYQLFLNIQTIYDLALVLGVKHKLLMHELYGKQALQKYHTFSVQKKSGGERIIESPNQQLKLIQKNLSSLLSFGLTPKVSTHGFIKERNICSNASIHLRKKFIINFDLKDFFSSIHFGRVNGVFKNYPFYFNDNVANVLANLCCYNSRLPQGAPTSPILSNFICRQLDNDLLKHAISNKCSVTRYADDITFSTNLKNIPNAIGNIQGNEFQLSIQIQNIVSKNGFIINNSKTRYSEGINRKEVTGLIVNKKLNVKRRYIKHIRLLLHNWEKFGLDKAAKYYYENYSKKVINENIYGRSYLRELVGKIGFIGYIKGKDDLTYKKIVFRLKKLEPTAALNILISENENEMLPKIYGEGKTDWKHLKAAYIQFKNLGLYPDLEIRIQDYDSQFEVNNSTLFEICRTLPKASLTKCIVICVFDADDPSYTEKVSNENTGYKYWQNNVYSMILPKPPHRQFSEVCIEHFYSDSELKILDENSRRLFLSDEFNKEDGYHLYEPIRYNYPTRLKNPKPFIIDNSVYLNEKNIALSKAQFADNILQKKNGFRHVNFQHFRLIFDRIHEIIKNHKVEV